MMSQTLTESEVDDITSPPTHHDSSTDSHSSLNHRQQSRSVRGVKKLRPDVGSQPESEHMTSLQSIQSAVAAQGEAAVSAAAAEEPPMLFRAKVTQSGESWGTANILGKLSIKATTLPRRRWHTEQHRDDIRESTLAPIATVTPSTTGNACQGICPPSRRHLTVLQGPSRGEEATKKLLAIGSAAEAKTRRPRGTRENPACNEVWRAHANIAALIAAAALHSLASQVLPFNGRHSTLPSRLSCLLCLHRPQRC